MIGHYVTINKSDYSQATGKVISVQDQKISLNLTKGITGVETNVWLTIQDEKGIEHTGTLFIN
jgi:activator of HSP90 ATPase